MPLAAAPPPSAAQTAKPPPGGSYYDEYMRSAAMLKHAGDRPARQLLTDRGAYISFLEAQLERVSAACLTVQTTDKRLAELEAAQVASDHKLSALGKVLRLNQEYVEQTTEQARTELAALADRMDAWMDKHAQALAQHAERLEQHEAHGRRLEDTLEHQGDATQRAVASLEATLEREVTEARTLALASEARVDSLHEAHTDLTHHVEGLRALATGRLDEDLERIRHSVSDKYVALERDQEELRERLASMAEALEGSWQEDLARLASDHERQVEALQDRLDELQRQHTTELVETQSYLRKCMDAQHLLSATVVGMQSEMDHSSGNGPGAAGDRRLERAVDELRATQEGHREALRRMQVIGKDAQARSDEQCERLAERLDAAEQQFARLAHDAIDKAEETRTRVLIALGEVEQKLRHDADAATEHAVQSVRSEYVTDMLAVITRLEDRLEALENSAALQQHRTVPDCEGQTLDRIDVRIPDARVPRSDPVAAPSPVNLEQLAAVITKSIGEEMKALRDELSGPERPRPLADGRGLGNDTRGGGHRLRPQDLDNDDDEDDAQDKTHGPMQGPPGRYCTRTGAPRRASATSSSSASSATLAPPRRRLSRPMPTRERTGRTTTAPTMTHRATTTASRRPKLPAGAGSATTRPAPEKAMTSARAHRLKELCLELVALEGSLKAKR